MDKFNFLIEFVGAMEPSTWVSMSGIKAGPYAVLIVCCYVLVRHGIRNGIATLFGYVLSIATLLFTFSLI